ncbi:hypothetical protein [Marinomonas foliarum]|uniref:Uncharacterized protein n=1 Tax=Marinomonas foliarum TaxID=491950 RepID=A0A369AF54_9GAMM|nr:hypothetical protein [Marinomonas foliarum]RCX07949.1 hypothetical protein DFP77_10349 [Marinomonas foliarum]
METIASSDRFTFGSESFFTDVTDLLFHKEGVQLTSVSAPQSVACYQTKGLEKNFRLRLVLIPLMNGRLLGRLSWLDGQGVDHVCCYVNEAFDCVIRKSDGVWIKQAKSAEKVCLQCFVKLDK